MKKIIYSLVIMIAAGSLFTSCIQQVEPEGIKALREAKARYYDALSQLRGKDGVLREAEAALKQAEAALKQAEAAHQQAVTDAYTKMQALERELKELEIAEKTMENELRAAQIEAEIDAIQKEMELANKQHEIDLINKQAEKAQAEEDLRVVLRDIALQAQDLTAAEKEAVLGAAEAYLAIWEEVQDQKIKVMEAEKALADAKRAKEIGQYNPDYAWDSETHSYQNLVDLYSRAIERAKGYIAEDEEALKNVPELPDVDAWNAELQAYQATADAAEYSRHELTQEAAAYYVTYVHDGVKAYNDAIDAWVEEHEAVANPGKAPEAPKEKDYPASKYGLNDTITVPALEQKTTPAYAKFEYLLDSYMTQDSPVSKADPKNKMIFINSEGNYDVVANIAMKDFILGDEYGDVKTQKVTIDKTKYEADYGLFGAVSVLLRDKVLNPDVPADPEKAREAADKALAAWQADHDTLAAGLLAYQPYIDALKAYNDLKNAEETNGDKMVKAVDALMEALNSVNAADLSKNDSVRIADAVAAYAKAREDYFDYAWDPEGADQFDRKFYWYGNGIGDTLNIAFRDITYAKLADKNSKFGKTVKDPQGDFAAKNTTIAHIIYQLVNTTFGNEIGNNDAPWSFSLANINDDNCKAFYTLYKYVPESAPGAGDAHFVLNDGMDTPYTSAAVTAAKKAVDDAIAAYKDCYERYWNETWPAAGTITSDMDEKAIKAAIEANPDTDIESYTLATFTEPFIIPNAWESANVPTGTNALGAILGSVDKAATQPKAANLTFFGGSDDSVVFGTAADPTDLNVYLYAEYLYQLALNPAVGDIAEIQAWVEAVAAAFDAQAEDAAAAAKKAYDKAVEQYNKDKAAYDKKKAAYDEYQAALKEFTGTRKVDGKDVINGLKKITGSYPDVASIQYKFELVDVIDGEWIETLGGKQLELANQYFPEFPAKLNEWYEENEKIDDDIAHAQILIAALKPAYFAAAKAAGYAEDLDAANYDELIENYKAARKAYVDAIKADIEAQEAAIDANMKLIADFESADSQADIDIAKAQADLDKETKKLNTMEEVLKGARENLERIFQYLETLDVNFVIIPTGDTVDPIIP
jgi:hypothetical protein